MRTNQGGPEREPTPADDITTLQNEKVVYVPDENYKNSLRDAKHQLDLLKDCFMHWLGRRTVSEM